MSQALLPSPSWTRNITWKNCFKRLRLWACLFKKQNLAFSAWYRHKSWDKVTTSFEMITTTMTLKWGTPSSAQQLEESSVYPKSSWDESWFPAFNSRGMPIIHKHLKRKLLSATGMWEGPWVCCLKWNGHRDALTRKKAAFPCSGLNAGSSFISQDEGMFESPVETLEKALGPRLISTGGLTSLQCFKRWRCLTPLENW